MQVIHIQERPNVCLRYLEGVEEICQGIDIPLRLSYVRSPSENGFGLRRSRTEVILPTVVQ
jgi:hypothetical protein